MELVLPRNYVEIEQEEMMYLEGGAVHSRVFYNKTGFRAYYALGAALGANAVYGGYLTAGAAASGLGLPLSMFTGVTAAYQGYIAGKLVDAASDAEILYSKYGRYRLITTSLFGITTGAKAEMV
ncbi:hypothetical protein [Facklamia sp. P9177]|uniref:hypothetical protein n=1 Tax=Facklamia sp. P9177 TaxID=3421945 RepID=UPI003D175823